MSARKQKQVDIKHQLQSFMPVQACGWRIPGFLKLLSQRTSVCVCVCVCV